MPGLLRRLRGFGRRLAPSLFGIALILLALLPFGLPQFSSVMPLLSVIAVYYWGVYRPDLLPAWAAFALGLVEDALSGGPLGLMALVLALVQGVCVSQRRFLAGAGFVVGWSGFALVAGGAALFIWSVSSLYYLHLFDPRQALAQWALTVFAYPLLAWTFLLAERRMLQPG
ncbi:MAG: rod shape-determining protein MreD [Alphaproteobacteria bacterium]|nr:rod shape-determining protein MreD [Alphaproteobacteria bacterium]